MIGDNDMIGDKEIKIQNTAFCASHFSQPKIGEKNYLIPIHACIGNY